MAVALAALLAMSAACGGCLFIAVPSLAYQGYKYESGGQQGTQAKQQHQNSQPPANDDIE
jgi:predicted SAM-dependent methyltransferase